MIHQFLEEQLEEMSAAHGRDIKSEGSFGGLNSQDMALLKQRGFEIHQGKVRDVLVRGQELYLLHSDRLSAFDRAIGLAPGRGQIIAELSLFWQQKLKSQGLPLVPCQRLHPRLHKCKTLRGFKVEVVVRGYLAGHLLRAMQGRASSIFVQTLAADARPYAKLPHPLLTPTTKAEVYEHDQEISEGEIISSQRCTSQQWQKIKDIALIAYDLGHQHALERGWILADTKYEFGCDESGQIFLMDEVHTPDSSRFWRQTNYQQRLAEGKVPEMFDKEIIRQWLLEQGFDGQGPVPEIPSKQLLQLSSNYLEVAQALMETKLRAAPAFDLAVMSGE